MIVYIISNTEKSVAFEIIAAALKNKEVHYILLQNNLNTPFVYFLSLNEISYQVININGKKNLVLAFIRIILILLNLKPCIVHTHLREANFLGLTAAWVCRVKHRIYTRHHSTFNFENFPKEVKWDKFLNSISTKIISISKNVSTVLINMETVDEDKIVEIPHGFYLEKYQLVTSSKVEDLKKKYNIELVKSPIVGVVSRYLTLKGIKYIIAAFADFKKSHPAAHLVLANAKGGDEKEIRRMLRAVLSEIDFTEITFENDVFTLFNLFDYYVHVPINKKIEAFGQTYVEALAASVPSIFTLSGIANEFIINGYNALVVEYKNSTEITNALNRLCSDFELRLKLQQNGLRSVQQFSHEIYINNHLKLYNKLCPLKDKH